MRFLHPVPVCLLVTVVAAANHSPAAWAHADVAWTGGGSDLDWSATANWNPQQQPTSGDNVFFAQIGSKKLGTVSNFLSADQAVQDLTYIYSGNKVSYQTTDLEGHTLQVNGTLAVSPQGGASIGQSIIQNGSLRIGNAEAAGNLYVSRFAGDGGFLKLTGSSVNAVLDSLVVAQSQGSVGSIGGALIGGSSGSVTIGSPATPGNVYVAYSMADTDTSGSLNLSGQDSLQAVVHNFWIGNSEGNSKAAGRVVLAKSNDIHADSMIVGNSHEDGVLRQYESTLQLGLSNNIVADQFLIGSDMSNTKVTIPAGGVVNIGGEDVATDLVIGRSDVEIWYQYEHTVDFSGAEFNAHLSNLTVGESLTTPDSQGPNLRATLTGAIKAPSR